MGIYFSLAAMDELIEAFSVINQMEKGALGLFFELNYLIGLFLTGYVTWFTMKFKEPYMEDNVSDDDKYLYTRMFNWVTFQYFYTYFSVIFMAMITWMYRKMDAQALEVSGPTKQIEMKNMSL